MESVLTVLLAACLGAAFVAEFRLLRLKKGLSRLSEQITCILDDTGDEGLGSLQEYAEGELEVLESQLGKMVLLLREQAGNLKNDKLLLKDAMANMSHQLKTPMTSLRLAVSMLAEEDTGQEQRLEYAQKAFLLLNRIDWLVSTLLKLSRLDAGTICFAAERVEFGALSRALTEQVEIAMDLKGQTLVSDVQKDSGFTGDFGWTLEAVLNIVKNCMEHTPEGRRLYLTMRENPLYSEILVEDEGPGIPAAEQRRIFERFYRGENASENSAGIGLALSADLIRQQNGTVRAENRRQGGARFVIRFHKGHM